MSGPELVPLEDAEREQRAGENVPSEMYDADAAAAADGEPVVDDDAEVARLAALGAMAYDRERKAAAEQLGVRVGMLDKLVAAARRQGDNGDDLGLVEPEPWPEPVEGGALLDAITAAIRRHVVMPGHAAEVVALWCIHTHAVLCWHHTPRLAITSPEKGCGKSVLLDVISTLTPRALLSDSLTEAVAFRLAEGRRPTFLIDECDTHLSSKNPDDGLRGILNSGAGKGHRAFRVVGEDRNKVAGYNTFAPAALAGIGALPGTLADRSIRITLARRMPGEPVVPFRVDRAGDMTVLCRKAARWAFDHTERLEAVEPDMPSGIENRRADVWRPLLAIADVAGGAWPWRARAAAAALEVGGDAAESVAVQLLADIRAAFSYIAEDKITSVQLAEHLATLEDRPWPEWARARKPITPVQIARLLRGFGIAPSTIRRGEITAKGYRAASFSDAFARYLPPEPSQRHNAQETAENPRFRGVTSDGSVTDQKARQPADFQACDGVTGQNGGAGEDTGWETSL